MYSVDVVVIDVVIAYFIFVVTEVVIAVRKNFSDAMNQLILLTEDKTKRLQYQKGVVTLLAQYINSAASLRRLLIVILIKTLFEQIF